MTMKACVCALVLGLTASTALACGAHQKQAQSCIPGMVWDNASENCVKEVSS